VSEHVGDEGRDLATQKVDELVALPWKALDRYEPRDEDVTSPSSRRFRVKSHAYWDMEAWQSDMRVTVKVYAPRGLHRYWPFAAHALRGGEDLPERPPSTL
jgi:hypothetical protein